jgi:hypothetical protein
MKEFKVTWISPESLNLMVHLFRDLHVQGMNIQNQQMNAKSTSITYSLIENRRNRLGHISKTSKSASNSTRGQLERRSEKYWNSSN